MRVHLVRGDCFKTVERNQRDIADLCAAGHAGFRGDGVIEMALPSAGAVFGRQEAGEHVGWKACIRIERLENDLHFAGFGVQGQFDFDLEVLVVVVHLHRRSEILAGFRNRDQHVSEPHLGELEARPVQA